MSINELSISLLLTLLVFSFQIIIPGIAIALLTFKSHKWTITDSFFIGTLWNLSICILTIPIFYDTFHVSITVKLSSLILFGVLFYKIYKNGLNIYKTRLLSALEYSKNKSSKILITLLSLTLLVFIFSHNLGFDDTAHLKYINSAITETPYPKFRVLVGEWQAARYPMFGVFIASLSHGITLGGYIIYYLFGILLILFFIQKVYEFIVSKQEKKFLATTTVIIIIALLSTVGYDNYLNFGIYPLQQSKIFFIMGLSYIAVGWGLNKTKHYFVIGLFLITFSLTYHLNLILLYAATLPIILIYLYFSLRKQSKKLLIQLAALSLIIPMFTVPAALSPKNGFLVFQEEPPSPPCLTCPKVERPQLSKFEELALRFRKVLSWFTDGRYKDSYIARTFTWEVILIPLLILIAIRIRSYPRVFILTASVTGSVVVLYQISVLLPQQLASSLLKSGPSWMLIDLLSSNIDFKNLSNKIVTDPYTELYFKLAGIANIKSIDTTKTYLSFSPLFHNQQKLLPGSVKKEDSSHSVLLNGRYWGNKAVKAWNNKDNEKAPIHQLSLSLQKYEERYDLSALKQTAKYGVKFLADNIKTNLLIEPVDQIITFDEYYKRIARQLPKNELTIYRDTIIIKLSKTIKGEELEFIFDSDGSNDYIACFTEGRFEKLKIKKQSAKYIAYDIKKDRRETYFIFNISHGHLRDLGSIRGVTIESDKRENWQLK